MGNSLKLKCCKKFKSSALKEVELEKEVTIPSFKSNSDQQFKVIEKDINFLDFMTFNDFAYALSIFNDSNATLLDDYTKKPSSYSKKDPFFNEHISRDLFEVFIDYKIFKYPNVNSEINDDIKSSCFKEVFSTVYTSLNTKLNQHTEIFPKSEDRVKKYHLMNIGILYCAGSNISKIRFIFNLFKNENEDKIKVSDEFKDFLLSLFLIPSYCLLNGIFSLKGKFQLIPEMTKDKMSELLKTSQLKDCVNLVDVVCKEIFGNDMTEVLSYDEWKFKFNGDDGIGYIISPRGIRKGLEMNDV